MYRRDTRREGGSCSRMTHSVCSMTRAFEALKTASNQTSWEEYLEAKPDCKVGSNVSKEVNVSGPFLIESSSN